MVVWNKYVLGGTQNVPLKNGRKREPLAIPSRRIYDVGRNHTGVKET